LAEQKIEWSFVSMMMTTHPVIANAVIPLFERYKKESDGKFEITAYNPETLVPTPELHQSVQRGLADICCFFPARYPNEFPIATLGDVPFLFANSRAASISTCMLYGNNKELQKEFSKFKVFSFSDSTPFDIVSIKPIHKLEDLKGLRIGVLDSSSVNIIQLLGGVPILLNLSDLYISLQRGMVDAVMSPLPTYRSTKVCEVAKYIIKCNIKVVGAPFVVNKNSYNSLPQAIKAIYDQFSVEARTSLICNWVEISTEKDLKWLIENNGVKVIEIPSEEIARWREAVKPAYDQWIDMAKKNGVKDPEAILAQLRGYAEKYNNLENQIAETAKYKDVLGYQYVNYKAK